ncbi:MAG: Lipopolysaccharide core heptosyltransferase RfaQ [Verrucomicrobiales bacterium]|nr:Lipopolysaccharide core heptosyltransferase RfaQ [Verrucomicrobiales bacterium]
MKILVISLAGIGDTLLATPLLRVLRERYPDAAIDLAVMWAGSRDILQGNPHINTVYFQNLLKEKLSSNLRFIARLRREKYDISINTYPQSKREYRIIARMIGAPLRLSHRHECSNWLDSLCVNREIDQDYNIHCIENNLNLLRLLDQPLPSKPVDCQLFFTDAEEQWAADWVRRPEFEGKRLLAVHVGSGKTKNLILKRWPIENYIQLLRKLLKAHGDIQVVLFGGPEEQEDNAQILAAIKDPRLVAAKSRSLKEAAALLRKCHVFLSVDNAFMHLAATMKVPQQIVIESPTFNKTIEPWLRPFRLVPNPLVAGRNLEYYLYDGKDIKGTREHLLQCMRSITPEAVLEVVNEVLG